MQPPSDPAPDAPASAGSGDSSGSAGAAGGDEAPSMGSGEVGEGDPPRWKPRQCAAGGPINADPSFWLMLGLSGLVLRRRARR
jgi:uncharacterized protein (TIGR03382 family)